MCGAKKFGVIILSLAKTPLLDITTTFNYVSLTFYLYFFVPNYPFAIMSTTAFVSTNHFLPLFDFSNVTIVTIVTLHNFRANDVSPQIKLSLHFMVVNVFSFFCK